MTAIHGILRAGAAYVPADPTGPAARAAAIFAAAGVKAAVVVIEPGPGTPAPAWPGRSPLPRLIVGRRTPRDLPLRPGDRSRRRVLGRHHGRRCAGPLPPARVADDLAYILFTSGSTGQAQGGHALARQRLHFSRLVPAMRSVPGATMIASRPTPRFHFDLSVFDLFVSCRNAATLVVIGESLAKEPAAAGPTSWPIAGISVWYSAPSILAMLTEHGGLDRNGFPRPDWSSSPARSFPIAPLRRLRRLWPSTRVLEPLRTDRDQRLHGLPDPRDDPRRPRPTRSRSARSALRSGPGWSTRKAATSPPGPLASW